MKEKHSFSRRTTLKNLGALGAAALFSGHAESHAAEDSGVSVAPSNARDVRRQIADRVWKTSLVDTHEHLPDEKKRFTPESIPWIVCNDWSILFEGYLFSDLVSAGLPGKRTDALVTHQLFTREIDPVKKWSLVEPYWAAVRNTGYGLALRLSIQELYGVDDLSARTIEKTQAGYEKVCTPGFYKRILRDICNIESCQVNSLLEPFEECQQPALLMQDIGLLGMISDQAYKWVPGMFEAQRKPTGIDVKCLADWHKVIDWWFVKYGSYAVAVKTQLAYFRDINHSQVPAERAETPFKKQLAGDPRSPQEQKDLEDHLFWYAVERANEHGLPVKLHTGYYAGENEMPLSRLINNPGSACDLCRAAPDTKFVFMHICYPYYEELIAVAKQYANAYLDMCWAWIVNPVAAKDFLKKYLVTAPANKILTFGADYVVVENVVGHAIMARRGIAQALSELVEEGWFSLDDALGLVEPIMHGNARELFKLEEKTKRLNKAPWA